MDLSAFESFTPKKDTGTLESLIQMAEEQSELKAQIDDLEETLSQLNNMYNNIATTAIPELMAELGLATFELSDGSKVSVKDFMSGSLPKEPKQFEEAIDWLVDNDLSSILKRDVILQFGKNEENFSKNAVELLKEHGYDPAEKYGVHPQTLYAALRELKKQDVDIPYETLGIFTGKKAEIKRKK